MNAGQRGSFVNRETGSLVSVYNAAEADLDTDGGAWAVVCEDHSSILNTSTARLAFSHGRDPRAWCEGCRESEPNGLVRRIVRDMERVGLTVTVQKSDRGYPFWGISGERDASSLLWSGIHIMVDHRRFLGGSTFGIIGKPRKIRTWQDFWTECAMVDREAR